MLWEVEIRPSGTDVECARLAGEWSLLAPDRPSPVVATSRGYLVETDAAADQIARLARELLVDPVTEVMSIHALSGELQGECATVLFKPGVMDPVSLSVIEAARAWGTRLVAVRTFRRYMLAALIAPADRELLVRRLLANEAVHQVVDGRPRLEHLTLDGRYAFVKGVVPLRESDADALADLSRKGMLALSIDEMRAVQSHFRELQRDPTDVELETIAQTWSEHCSHKTLRGRVECDDGRVYDNLLKETIFAATVEIRRRLGPDDWCISVFEDNAGVVRFDDRKHLCFKVETHNRPSAIEPYGGANTGVGGVIRDVLGTGLGGRPIANTDVFCLAPPDTPLEALPPGVLHPRAILRGVVAGVRDYGNRTGIPTVNGAVVFDERYLANPLVFCGTVGIIPVDRANKEPRPGDLIVAVGGRTGRDGIHGATFSSASLSAESEQVAGGAVQIGNAITEKKVLDVLLAARDRNLFNAVTDCGAGGFSSAVGEMAAGIGADVHLDRALLKYAGLSYTEIWISEAQERMVLSVPPARWPALKALCEDESVEAFVLGTFVPSGQLRLYFSGELVGDLSMSFLHEGRPKTIRRAVLPCRAPAGPRTSSPRTPTWANDALKAILAAPSVRSKEAIIRQYDHEVQGGTVIKPLVGIHDDGPGDAAVLTPVLGEFRGVAVGCGINPRYGDLDPYAMAACAIDEAVRNVIAVGADPARVAILDNFSWGNTDDPATLGCLVRAAEACREVAVAFGTPFISGKDSLHNEYRAAGRHIAIPGTLLISALGQVRDVRRCVTMDLKSPGNPIYLVGSTRAELGGSHFDLVAGGGGDVPRVDLQLAPRLFGALHRAIFAGMVRACHDLSEGGLAVAAAEMAFAGGVGADLDGAGGAGLADDVWLFSESPTRWLVEVRSDACDAFESEFAGLPCRRVGRTVAEPRLRLGGGSGEWLVWASLDELKSAWQTPLGL